MENQKRNYSLDFKLKAVELSNQRGSLSEVAMELDISKETLRNWTRGRYLGVSSTKDTIKSQEEQDNIKLRKALYEVTLERDILKKAVGIFSKSER